MRYCCRRLSHGCTVCLQKCSCLASCLQLATSWSSIQHVQNVCQAPASICSIVIKRNGLAGHIAVFVNSMTKEDSAPHSARQASFADPPAHHDSTDASPDTVVQACRAAMPCTDTCICGSCALVFDHVAAVPACVPCVATEVQLLCYAARTHLLLLLVSQHRQLCHSHCHSLAAFAGQAFQASLAGAVSTTHSAPALTAPRSPTTQTRWPTISSQT